MHFLHIILETEISNISLNSYSFCFHSSTHHLYRTLIILLRPDKLITVNCETYNRRLRPGVMHAQSVIELKRFRISYALYLPSTHTYSPALALFLSLPGTSAQIFFYDTPLRGCFNVLNIITRGTKREGGEGGVEQGRRTISALHTN